MVGARLHRPVDGGDGLSVVPRAVLELLEHPGLAVLDALCSRLAPCLALDEVLELVLEPREPREAQARVKGGKRRRRLSKLSR